MPTQPSQATAEGMPKIQMTRRSLLAGIVCLTAPVPTRVSAALADVPKTELEELIEQHRIALNAASSAWDRVSEIEDATDWSGCSRIQVQVGNLLSGWDNEGNQILRPIYAYSDTDVDNHLNRTLRTSISLAQSQLLKDKTLEHYDQKRSELKAVLRRCEAERQSLEDNVGLTSAKDEARRCSSIAIALEDAIIEMVPGNLADAALKAHFIISQDDNVTFFEEARLMDALKSIAAASGYQRERNV